MNKLQFFQFSVFQYSNLPSPSNPELEFCYLSELDNAIPASIGSAVAYLNGQLTPQSKLLEPSVGYRFTSEQTASWLRPCLNLCVKSWTYKRIFCLF